jgi:hypothetical protein
MKGGMQSLTKGWNSSRSILAKAMSCPFELDSSTESKERKERWKLYIGRLGRVNALPQIRSASSSLVSFRPSEEADLAQ